MPQKKNSKPKKTGKCHVCGDTGHYARDCEERKSGSEEVVLQDTTGKCHVCGETGHYARECKEKKSDTVKVVLQDTTRNCHLCGYTGHYARDCKERKSDSKKVVFQDPARECNVYRASGDYAREQKFKESGTVKVVLKEMLGFTTTSYMKDEGWYLSFGSSAHACYSRDMFVDYNPKRNHELILENNDRVYVAGIGTVVLRFTTGKVLSLSNVLHIPAISKCLVSVSKLDVFGYIISFEGRRCIIKKSDEVIIGNGYGREEEASNRLSRKKEKKGGASHHFDIFSTLYRLSLLEEKPVKKVVLDETIGLLESNEHPKLSKTRSQGWYLLSRCTVHVCNSRGMFVDYQPVTGQEVVLENNSPIDVVGFGTVKLQLTSGKVLTLENVFHMPKIMKCCISVGKLTKMGFTVGFWGEGCDIKKDDDIVGNGYIEDKLYRLSVVDEHSSADYDPMIDPEVNVDNGDHADAAGSVNSVLDITTDKANDKLYRLSVVDEHPSADYDPMIDPEVNVDNEDDVDAVGTFNSVLELTTDEANDSGIMFTCGGRQCVFNTGDHTVPPFMYNDGVLYKFNLYAEPRLITVVHHETIGLLLTNEHPKVTEAKARRWYLLTRCTVHVCNSRDMFADYQPVTGHEVILENNSHVDVVGYGTVKLQLNTGNVLTLKNVFHMPAIVKCCISMNKLMEMGLGVAFHGEGCYVKKGDQIMGNGFVEDGMFRMGLISKRSGGNQE